MTKILRRTITCIMAVTLIALSLSSCGGTAGASGAGVVISEVVTSNTNSLPVPGLGSPDWVEIYNGSGSAVNLNGYILRNASRPSVYYTFPNSVIEAGQYVTIYCCDKPSDERLADFCTGFKLSKSGVGLILLDARLSVIDEVEIPLLDTDVSWARSDEDFLYCVTPTPGKENGGVMGPDMALLTNVAVPTGLRLNEATEEWAEIYNGSKETVNLANYCLSDNSANLSKWRFPDFELAPGGYYVVGLKREIGDTMASFGMSDAEENLYFAADEQLIGSLTVQGLFENMSAGLDSTGNAVYFPVPTPGAANGEVSFPNMETAPMTSEDPVRISEILLENTRSLIDEYGDRSPWVEIHNYGDTAVDLSYFYLSDNPFNLGKWRLPEQVLEPGGYVIIYLSGMAVGNHTGFRVARDEKLLLLDFASMHVQTVEVANESRLDNISYGEQDGQWLYFGQPTPGTANTSHGSESITTVEKLDREGVYINEVSAAAMPRYSSNRQDGRDWIELYNGGDSEVDLTGWHLGQDMDDPLRCELSGSIPAKAYKVIHLSASSGQPEGTLPMGLDMAGEELVLTDNESGLRDVFRTGALRYKLTSGRAEGDYTGDRYFFETSTPGAANASPIKQYSQNPVFSQGGGFYDTSFTLEMTGQSIYYTLDGSAPDANSTPYTGPITISGTTVVTAVSIEAGKVSSDVVVANYLFEQRHTVPVVCVSMDKDDFDEVNLSTDKLHSTIRERHCNIEYYDTDGRLGTSFPAGLRLTGGGTRTHPQKSYNIYLRGGYGQSSVVYPFFEDYAITEFTSITLRNGGQDNQPPTGYIPHPTFMTDAYCSMLGKKFNADYVETRYAVLYVNGEYRGLYELKENQNEDFFASRYGIDAEEVNSVRRNNIAMHGSNEQYKNAREFAKASNIGIDANYQQLCQWVDVDAFIDHIFLEAYTGQEDHFNQKYWSTADYSVKIRPMWYDLDICYFRTGLYSISTYFSGEGPSSNDGSRTNMWIPTGLKQSEEWRERLYQRWAYHLTHTLNDRLELFDEMYAQMEPEMQRHCARWKQFSYDTWKSNAAWLRGRIEGRNGAFKQYMQSYFGLSEAKMAELFG